MPTEHSPDEKLEIGHVLFLDIVGYSKLLTEEQKERLGQLTKIVLETPQVRESVDEELVRLPTGDGVALVFRHNSEEPARCALEIAEALRKHPEIPVRMGIHSGPVSEVIDVSGRKNIAGAGINLAQRVMDCGDAGHILLSQHVADDLMHSRQWAPRLRDLGECEVKHGVRLRLVNLYDEPLGNPEPPEKFRRIAAVSATGSSRVHPKRMPWRRIASAAAVAALLIGAGVLFLRRQTPPASSAPASPLAPAVSEKSIAVLPFADLSQAKDQEYFCDGMSEELLDGLAKIDGLRVVARTSSFSFKGSKADVNEIGRKLNVASVLEGSLRREGDRVRISAHLVNTKDGMELWHETYDRKLEGVFALQDEITHAIVEALKIKLAIAPPPRAQPNTEAYDLYLQGLFFSNKSTEHDLRKSLDLFEQALAADPKLGRAWTGIAKAWCWLADAYVKPLEGHSRSQEAANRALAIDERDADAHVYLGETKRILSYDVKGEELELKRALEIDPNSAIAHLFMGLWQTADGNRAEGSKEIQTAIRLDPLSTIVGTMAVHIYLANDRFDQATAEAQRTMEIDPNYVYFEPDLARVYRQQGKLTEALEIYLRVEETRHEPMAGLAITYAGLGRKEEARKVLNQLIQQANSTYFPGEEIAAVYVSLGENDEAIHWLERAVSEHSGAIHGISSSRDLRPLHSDPRFVALLRQIGLDPAKSLRRD